MSTKTLTITEEAYERLDALRGSNESFSKAIVRITGKVDIMEVAGILTEKEALELELSIKDMRKRSSKRADEMVSALAK